MKSDAREIKREAARGTKKRCDKNSKKHHKMLTHEGMKKNAKK